MRKKLVRYWVLGVFVVVGGCSKPAAPPPTAGPAKGPDVVRYQDTPTGREHTPPAAKEEPPLTAAELERAAPQVDWTVAKGKLDDSSFVTLSARYVAVVAGLPQERRTGTNLLLALEAILYDAHIEPEAYKTYAEKVTAEPARRKRVGDRIVKLVEQRTGYRPDADSLLLPSEAKQ
jgi:hypothetical protein